MYHSEFRQDRWLDEEIFKKKEGGVFFECGALDGILDSNSLFFEQERGWTGLCVEANPESFAALKENRKCSLYHAALYDRDDYAISFVKIEGGLKGWGGVRSELEPQHIERMMKHTTEEQRATVQVPAITLDTVLSKHNLKKIDYMTLDIEGAEYKVLKAFPFVNYDIDILEVEDNFQNYPIRQLLEDNGFTFLRRMGVSDMYRKANKS